VQDNTNSVIATSSSPQHKSGVRSGWISEVLSFNVGFAFTYVFHLDASPEPLKDLNTAKEYINREITRLITLCATTPSGRDVVSNPDLTERHFDLIDRVIDVEAVGSPVRELYMNLLDSLKIPTYTKCLEQALIDLDQIIETYQQGATADGNLIQ
jgi:hypothetical protein